MPSIKTMSRTKLCREDEFWSWTKILEYFDEKNVRHLSKSLGFYSRSDQTSHERPNFWRQNLQKVLPCRHFLCSWPLNPWSMCESQEADQGRF